MSLYIQDVILQAVNSGQKRHNTPAQAQHQKCLKLEFLLTHHLSLLKKCLYTKKPCTSNQESDFLKQQQPIHIKKAQAERLQE